MTATRSRSTRPDGRHVERPVPRTRAHPRKAGAIDCQCHLYVPEILARLERRRRDPVVYRRGDDRYVRMGAWHRRVFPHHCDVQALLARMDATGIAQAVLSSNDPGPEWFGRDAPAVARAANDFIASVVRRHPHRFLGLAVLPLLQRDAAEQEFERCCDRLGLHGVLLYTNLAGRFPDEARFRWLFAAAERRRLPVLLHPACPVTMDVVSAYEMTSTLGNMFENTIALTRLILAGVFDEFPRLKLVCPHLGGTLPYIIGRLEHQIRVLGRGPRTLARTPLEYLRQVWFDVVSPLPEALRFAVDLLGPNRLLFASDHPWVDPQVILDVVRAANLPRAARNRILRGNARRLFRRSRSVSR